MQSKLATEMVVGRISTKQPKLMDLIVGFKLFSALCFFLLCNCCDSSNLTATHSEQLDSGKKILGRAAPDDGGVNEQQSKFACSQTTYVYNTLSSTAELSDSSKLPQTAINGQHLKVCSQGFTCCTEEMETRLLNESRKEFQKSVQDKIVGLSHTFESRTSKFDKFFRELIANSRRDLHQMFVRTYGLLYEQNSDIFSTLFDELTSYYIGKQKVNLEDSVDKFYQQLYRRMFRILNQHYQFDSSYWDCMARHMEQLKPFGDVPAKMKQQVTRALVAAKTFINGLSIGRDVVRQIMELPPSSECGSALMRMMFCPHCRGIVDVKPCSNFCLNVMKGCLAYQTELDHEWNEYLAALLHLLERLEGPFNIESVIDPIDVKISDAIMIFQDKGQEITTQIFAGCGNPKMNRRRSIKKKDASLTDLKFGNPSQSAVRPTTAAGTSLDRLAKDVREKLTMAKDFWRNLPYVLCNDHKVSASNRSDDSDCWNGLSKDKYQTALVGDGIVNQLANPEVSIRLGPSNNGVNDLAIKLRLVSTKLRQAYNGQNVEFRSKQSTTPQHDKTVETSGDGFIGGDNDDDDDDVQNAASSGDAENETPDADRKASKKLTTLETDDEDLLKEASGDDDSFSGNEPVDGGESKTERRPVSSNTTKIPSFATRKNRIKPTPSTSSQSSTTIISTTDFYLFPTDTSYTNVTFGFVPELQTVSGQAWTTEATVGERTAESTVQIVSSTVSSSTKRYTSPTRQQPSSPSAATTIGRWAPATTLKPTVYVVYEAGSKNEKPNQTKGAILNRVQLGWFGLLLTLSVFVNYPLQAS